MDGGWVSYTEMVYCIILYGWGGGPLQGVTRSGWYPTSHFFGGSYTPCIPHFYPRPLKRFEGIVVVHAVCPSVRLSVRPSVCSYQSTLVRFFVSTRGTCEVWTDLWGSPTSAHTSNVIFSTKSLTKIVFKSSLTIFSDRAVCPIFKMPWIWHKFKHQFFCS